MRLLQLSCDLQTLNLALIYCHTILNFVHIHFLCLSQVIFQDFLLKDQFPVPVSPNDETTCPHHSPRARARSCRADEAGQYLTAYKQSEHLPTLICERVETTHGVHEHPARDQDGR